MQSDMRYARDGHVSSAGSNTMFFADPNSDNHPIPCAIIAENRRLVAYYQSVWDNLDGE